MSETLREALGQAVKALKKEPETLVEALPDIMYVADVSEEVECEDDDRFYGASPDRDDLVGSGGASLVGIYKLIAVQQLEKYEKVRVTGTEFTAPGSKVLDIDLGKGGASMAGDSNQIESVGFDAVFEEAE